MTTFFQEDEILGKAYDARIARRLLTYVRPYAGVSILAMVLLALVSLVDLVGPALTLYGIDHYIVPTTHDLSYNQRGYGLLIIASIYILVLIVGFTLRYLHELLLIIVGQRIMF